MHIYQSLIYNRNIFKFTITNTVSLQLHTTLSKMSSRAASAYISWSVYVFARLPLLALNPLFNYRRLPPPPSQKKRGSTTQHSPSYHPALNEHARAQTYSLFLASFIMIFFGSDSRLTTENPTPQTCLLLQDPLIVSLQVSDTHRYYLFCVIVFIK